MSYLHIGIILAVLAVIGVILSRWVIVPSMKRRKIEQYGDQCRSIYLPAISKTHNHLVNVTSRRPNSELTYRVNLFKLTCSCDGFRKWRCFYGKNDIRRLCRHLRRELRRTEITETLEPLTQRLIKDRVRDRCYLKVDLPSGDTAAFGYHPNVDYVRVFARTRGADDPENGPYSGSYEKFVLDIHQNSWIYGTSPPETDAIIAALKQFMEEAGIILEDPHR